VHIAKVLIVACGGSSLLLLEGPMRNTNSLSRRAVRCLPRLPLPEIPKPVRPLWCQVRDTPWVKTMRRQVATATLVGGRGFPRAWRFEPVVTEQ
jgi:hypothetical protein